MEESKRIKRNIWFLRVIVFFLIFGNFWLIYHGHTPSKTTPERLTLVIAIAMAAPIFVSLLLRLMENAAFFLHLRFSKENICPAKIDQIRKELRNQINLKRVFKGTVIYAPFAILAAYAFTHFFTQPPIDNFKYANFSVFGMAVIMISFMLIMSPASNNKTLKMMLSILGTVTPVAALAAILSGWLIVG